MSSEDFSIRVKHVSKDFKIAHEKRMRLKDYFLAPFSKTSYSRFDALKDISFDVKKGEFVGIIGRNGSGKSTLLKILSGVYMPKEGAISTNGKLVPLLELGVGFNPELTGKENIFLNGTILGMTNQEIVSKYNKIVEFAEIEQFMDTQLKYYSSGMQIRLAFAIAIQAQGDIYLLDEILAVGDAGFQSKSKREILRLKNEGKTIIFVSHDHDSISKFADKVVWVKDSKVEAIGSGQKQISEVIKKYLQTFMETDSKKNESEEIEKKDKTKNNRKIDVKVDLLNSKKISSKVFEMDSSCSINLDYIVHDEEILNGIIFGISIMNENGVVVYGTNTALKKKKAYKAIGIVSFRIKSLNLLPGTYVVTAGVHSPSDEVYFWDEKKYIFTVFSNTSDVGIAPLNVEVDIT